MSSSPTTFLWKEESTESEDNDSTAYEDYVTPEIPDKRSDWSKMETVVVKTPAARSISVIVDRNIKNQRVGRTGSSHGSNRSTSHSPNQNQNDKKTVVFQDQIDIGRLDIEGSDSQKVSLISPVSPNSEKNRGLYCTSVRDRKMSLVGKPLSYKNYRTDQRFRRMQSKIHNFLERPRGWRAASYHLAVLVMVLMCLALSVFSTMPDFEEGATLVLYYLEIIFVIWLAIEYVCRVWSAGCRSRYRGLSGRIRFATSAYCVIDIIVILASITVLCIGATGQVFAASAIRGLRFFQILRMLRIDRRAGTWKLLGSVVWAHRQELLTTVYIGFLGLIFSSFLVYLCEKNTNDKYSTFADALWWGVITLSTVGYGDKTPETWPGKIIAAFCALLGISFFALPAGILGSGFALKVQQHQRQKHLIRRRVPAARLIQCLWRHYSAAPESCSLATWKVHLAPAPSPVQPTRCGSKKRSLSLRWRRKNPQNGSNHVERRMSDSSDHPSIKTTPNGISSGLMSRIRQSTKRKLNNGPDIEVTVGTPTANNVASVPIIKTLLVPRPSDNISIVSTSDISELEQLGTLGFSLGNWRSKSKTTTRKSHDDSALHTRVTNSNSIGPLDLEGLGRSRGRRSLSLCRYLQSDNQQPEQVIGDYSLMMAPLYQWCEQMRRRSQNPLEDTVWNQLTTCAPRKSLDDSDGGISTHHNLAYDDIPSLQPRTLDDYTPVIKNVVRAIRRIQLLVARRKFKEALKPYDVKDVIEQYSAGHVDLQSRVKCVQQRLDLIVGKSTDKNEVKIPLNQRIIHVERQVEKMDKKLDVMLEMLISDRRMREGRGMSPPHSAHARLDNDGETEIKRHSSDLSTRRFVDLPRPIRKPVASTETLEMFTARSHSPAHYTESSPLLRSSQDVVVDIGEDQDDHQQ